MGKGDQGLETLLYMDEFDATLLTGVRYKIEARRVDQSPEIPHGIRYSLVVLDSDGNRVIGYDNAHGIDAEDKPRFAARRTEYDHKHDGDKVWNYHFTSPEQLLADFFKDLDTVAKRFED